MIRNVHNVEDVFKVSKETGVYVSVNPEEPSERLMRSTVHMADKMHGLIAGATRDADTVPEFFHMAEKALRKKGSEITDYFGLSSVILASDVTKLRCWQQFGKMFNDQTGMLPPLMVLELSKKKDDLEDDMIAREITFAIHHSTRKKFDCEAIIENIHDDINKMIGGLLNAYGYSIEAEKMTSVEMEDDDLIDAVPDYATFMALGDKKYEA